METKRLAERITKGKLRRVSDAQGTCGLMHPKKNGVAVAWLSSSFSPSNGYVAEKEHELGRPEREANAELIAEAFNITNQTGLSPKELMEQRNELLKALEDGLDTLKIIANIHPVAIGESNACIESIRAMEAAIQKIQP